VSDASTLRWQRWLLGSCAIGFVFWALSFFQDDMWWGQAGLSKTFTSVAFHDAVKAVTPGGPAAEAGIKSGDIVDLGSASAPDRWRFRTQWVRDEPLTYVVLRGATERRVTFRPRYKRMDLSSWSWFVGALGTLIFATIIAWLRPWLIEARILCLLLTGQVVRVCLQWNNFVTPWPALDFGASLAYIAIIIFVTALLVAYTLLFGQPISVMRKAIVGFTFLVIGLDLIKGPASNAGMWSGAIDLWGGPIGTTSLLTFWYPFAYWALPPLVFATAVVAARGRERSLLIWTSALPFLTYFVQAVAIVAQGIPALASNPLFFAVARNIINGAEFLTPFAIGYALLSRSRFSPMTAAAGTMA
jgi:hypothetical protein